MSYEITTEVLNENIDYTTYGFPVYTPVSLSQAALTIDRDWLEETAKLGEERLEGYQTFRDWYDGKHCADLTAEQRQALEASGIEFADNFIDIIVDAIVRRLKLVGFAFSPEQKSETPDSVVDVIMRRNKMDIGADRVHHAMCKLGDAFVIVDYDEKLGTSTIKYNKPDMMKPIYSDDNGEEMEMCVKRWDTNSVSPFNPQGKKITRVNIYYANRIEKYYRAIEGKEHWMPFMDLADGDMLWPVPWVDEATGEPLGIPVFHFKNKTLDGDFGVSEIKKAIPQQAALNKMVLDLLQILETQGYPQRWATGVEDTDTGTDDDFGVGDDDSGVALPSEPGDLWTNPNENAKYGQFDPANVTGALAAIEMMVHHISASNATPIYDLMGGSGAPSGEALKMRDSGLGDKVEEKQTPCGNVWEDVMIYCLKLHNLRAVAQVAVMLDEIETEATWEDTAPRNEKSLAEVLTILVEHLGASQRWALEKYGVENVQEVMDEALAEKEAVSERTARQINRGIDETGMTAPTSGDAVTNVEVPNNV